jgi:hypothetical protein
LSCEVPWMYLMYFSCIWGRGSWDVEMWIWSIVLPRSVPFGETFEVDVSGMVLQGTELVCR